MRGSLPTTLHFDVAVTTAVAAGELLEEIVVPERWADAEFDRVDAGAPRVLPRHFIKFPRAQPRFVGVGEKVQGVGSVAQRGEQGPVRSNGASAAGATPL